MNRKKVLLFAIVMAIFASTSFISISATIKEKALENTNNNSEYKYPEFYKGIYLNHWSGRDFKRLKKFTKLAKASNINSFVIDVQPAKKGKCLIPKSNIDYLIKNGIHPIARVVCFQDGLKYFPVKDSYLQKRINIAISASKVGFKEIQFDYIRFNDYKRIKNISRKQKYAFIEGFLRRARKALKPYGVKTAADIFGRIPLNKGDTIGQKMEGIDKVVDVICPMAYPSHYTWSKKMQKDPYYTVHLTSKRAKERAKNAQIVSYIQAFEIKIKMSGMTYAKYIEEQIRACHDAGIRGYLFWNARQVYTTPFKVTKKYYNKTKKISKNQTKKESTNI